METWWKYETYIPAKKQLTILPENMSFNTMGRSEEGKHLELNQSGKIL